MDIEWRMPNIPDDVSNKNKVKYHFSEMLNSMVSLFAPDSRKLFKNFFDDYTFFDFRKKLCYNDMIKFCNEFIKIPGDDFVQKLLFTIGVNFSTSLYYAKIYVHGTEISEFSAYEKNYTNNVEPMDIELSSETNLFGINYKFKECCLFNKIKIQETFKNFKLISIYIIIDKSYSIVKINEKWYIYDDVIGFNKIPYTLTNNIIIFGKVELNNLTFSFDKVKECIVFYLKETKFNTINPKFDYYRECDCNDDLGWMQMDKQFCISGGICWFDSGMMSFFIPIKLRKIFLKPFNEKYQIPKDKLFPCNENFYSSDKGEFIKDITNLDVTDKNNKAGFITIIKVIFSSIGNINDIPLYLIENKDDIYRVSFKYIFFTSFEEYSLIPVKKFNYKFNFFALYFFANKYFEYPKNIIDGFFLQSILVGFNLYNIPNHGHGVAIINCKQGWYLYDDNLAKKNKNMIKLNPSLKNELLYFEPIKYNYNNKKGDIIIDLPNCVNLIYIYAK